MDDRKNLIHDNPLVSTENVLPNSTAKKLEKTSSNTISNPIVENGYVRDGTTISKAVDLQENVTTFGSINNNYSSKYYRYYAQFPYEYVNITISANTTPYNVNLLDQFNSSIISGPGTTTTQSLVIASSSSSYHNKIRFIGWYYINISTYFSAITYEIQFHFVKGDGSSLWDPIQIQPGSVAWSGTFKDKENSGFRDSTFYSFYVNTSFPKIAFQNSNFSYVWLYGPQMNYLNFYYGSGTWLASQSGYYYLEVSGSSLIGSFLSISLSLSQTNETLGYRIDQALEIPRNTALHDSIAKPYQNRYLKLYLYIGENVSINFGNNESSTYDVTVYGPWGKGDTPYSYVDWFQTTTSLQTNPINLFNVENTGYYIFQISGPVGPYSVHLDFKYQIKDGISWESAKTVQLGTNYTDHHYLFTNDSYYYKIYFSEGANLNISLQSVSIKDAVILGKYRQEIGYIDLSNNTNFITYQNITTENFMYIKINPNAPISNFLISITKLSDPISPTINIDGILMTKNKNNSKNETVPLIKISLIEKIGSRNYILAITSTDEFGYFSLTYTKTIVPLTASTSLYLQITFDGPALQLMNYNSPTPNEVTGNVYSYTLLDNINTSLLPHIQLGNISVPNWSDEIAHIFATITKGWLWINNLGIETIPPKQITVLYSANSPGTYYSPISLINNKMTKYVINLLGTNTGDDDGWDDTVVLHEYGHHIEQTYGFQNNPGGTHYYYTTISPDLAHAEGFPTFFASVVLNSTIYKDTNSNGYNGINLETGTMITSPYQLEDLFGAYGETSVFTLYHDLIDKTNTDDINHDGIGDSVTLPVKSLFNVFFNFRRENGLGVTTTNDVYQGLIDRFPSLIDNISKTFYDHGNSFYAYPFMVGGTNKIISSSDLTANLTWKLYDGNPKSYQIVLDGNLIKTGNWNFTEEILLLPLHQFNFSIGSTHYITLRINDTLDNERIYTFQVKVIESYNLLGTNYTNSINIIPDTPILIYPNASTYFQYTPVQTGIINLTYIASSYNLSLYDHNFALLSSYQNTNLPGDYLYSVQSGTPLYLFFTYLTGNNSIDLEINTNPVGYSISNPLSINDYTHGLTVNDSITSMYYMTFSSSYTNRLLTFSLESGSIQSLSIYFENNSLLNQFDFSEKNTSFSYIFPLIKGISNTNPFNPFCTFLIILSASGNRINTTIEPQTLEKPSIMYSGPSQFVKNQIHSLTVLYSGFKQYTYLIYLNNTFYLNGSMENFSSGSHSLSIPINSLDIGFYVVNLDIIDFNGLQCDYQFTFSITNSLETSMTSNTNSSFSKINIFDNSLIYQILVILLIIGVLTTSLIVYDLRSGKKLSSKIKKFLFK